MKSNTSFLLLISAVLATVRTAPPLSSDAIKSKCGGDDNIMDCIYRVNKNGVAENEDAFSTKIRQELFEGDIVWTKKLKAQLSEMRTRSQNGMDAFDAINNGAWRNGIVPYRFANGFSYKSVVSQAISEYRQKTCIKFVPYTRENARTAGGYVEFMHGGGCYSMIGRQGGRQQISLGNGCGYKATAIHEMMHALGWFHEQSRRDRDSYITINWNSIPKKLWYNFEKYRQSQASTLGAGYDKRSVMHYGNYAFSTNRQKTIVSKSNPSETLGNRVGLSTIDVQQLNKYYKCGGTTVITAAPPKSCKNLYEFCTSLSRWCRNNWVSINCKATCNKCVKPTKKPTKKPRVCVNKNSNCNYWARRSYCTHRTYKTFMARNCKLACSLC